MPPPKKRVARTAILASETVAHTAGADISEKENRPKEVELKLPDKKKYFDVPTDILENLRFTDVSLYSSTPTEQSKYTAELLLSYYSKNELTTKTLTDATACIGGNTWIFADYVKQVTANELANIHAEILENNMKALNKKNITFLNRNYLDIYLSVKQDIIFFDPPWGGTNYKQFNDVEIQLMGSDGQPKKLDEIILGLLQYKCETMILKLPVNYSIKKITNNCTFINIDDLVIKAIPDNKPLYRLVILSHLPKLKEPVIKSFHRLAYKSINFIVSDKPSPL